MSNSNYILEMLGFKEKGLFFYENLITYKIKKDIKYRVLHATLTTPVSHCPTCGSVNEEHAIIKHGFKCSTITMCLMLLLIPL